MDYCVKIKKLVQFEKRKWVFLVGLVGLTHLFCQSLMLPYGNALLSLLPDDKSSVVVTAEDDDDSSVKISILGTLAASNLDSQSLLVRRVTSTVGRDIGNDDDKGSVGTDNQEKMNPDPDMDDDDDFDFVEDETLVNNSNNVDMDKEGSVMQIEISQQHESLSQIGEQGDKIMKNISVIQLAKESPGVVLDSETSEMKDKNVKGGSVTSSPLLIESQVSTTSSAEGHILMVNNKLSDSTNGSSVKKKMRCDMPPKTVTPVNEMERILVRNRARSRAMRPRWSSERDQEILTAKLKIESPPILNNDPELYAPLFRNISMFKRSYELMERVLKVYVYKEGEKPIFHQPILKGLYASEGWFMKLMEGGNKRFLVKDPRKAHLFYMPFSSRMLEYTLYVRNSHNRTNLRHYLKDYSEKIASKYRFWNRTGGADHFLVACHDWAPYETRHHMEHCIKALCNADVTGGFKIGRDVSLPETYVRSARNPLRDLGGKPPSQRSTLAFFAGNMHGYLRPILLNHWTDKDPRMKILGPMPPGVASKMNYIHQMKNSKYCICPKGYEVNSPRIVESIFYECVPVIISDNFIPPFFEVLNWDAFSVIIAEKDIPNLKTILVSIPDKKYLDMQLNVRKVQKHFLWHAKPLKYDLFHMTLHSIWYNRVFQIKTR
ncbi:hypothetical protein ABFX02_10G106400 [Erythranthe guttata]